MLLNWLPTLLGDRGLSKPHASLVAMLFGMGGAVGILVLADLLDRRGRRMIGLWYLGLIASLVALAVVNSGFLATALAGFHDLAGVRRVAENAAADEAVAPASAGAPA